MKLGNKFGETNISFLSNTKPIIESDLLPTHVYLQVIDVKPFFPKNDVENRTTQYHQNFNVSQFIFESPFTKEKDGKMYTEDPSKQWKRKIVVNTEDSAFPIVTCRLEVKSKKEEELSPIEVGMEAIAGKMQLLKNELGFVIDKKTLAIQLHGTLLTQVNAGPIAIAQIFFNPATIATFDQDIVLKLKGLFKSFVELLAEAITRQKPLIDTNEVPIQIALEESYFKFKKAVCVLIEVPTDSITENFTNPEDTEESGSASSSARSLPSNPGSLSSSRK